MATFKVTDSDKMLDAKFLKDILEAYFSEDMPDNTTIYPHRFEVEEVQS